jgi:cell wall-associated NlpC family hydrolase
MTPQTAATPAPEAPPVESLASGPVSQQPIGAPSQEMTASGESMGNTAPAPAASGDLGITPAQASSTTQTSASTSSGVNSALVSQIATAISLGLAATPTTAAGWAQLADFYSTPAGENQIETAATSAPANSMNPTGATAPGTTASGATGTAAFLAAIRQHESGGDYTAENAAGGASGAYQFINSTWASEANAAGYGQYAGVPAGMAPAGVQDAVAKYMATNLYKEYGNWADAAEAWYDPADVGKNVVPDPGAGNKESVTSYGAQILQLMGQQAAVDPESPSAGATNNIVKIAQSAIGTPYSWGGGGTKGPSTGIAGDPNDPEATKTVGFDCSGLSEWVYAQAGVALPRTAQAQYNATAKVAKGVPLQAGDLLFFGSGTGGIEHVGIYIGNNQMIDAPHGGADVRIDSDPTSWGNYVGATRPGDPTGASTAQAGTPAATTLQQSQDNYGSILQTVTQQLGSLNGTYPGLLDTTEAVVP